MRWFGGRVISSDKSRKIVRLSATNQMLPDKESGGSDSGSRPTSCVEKEDWTATELYLKAKLEYENERDRFWNQWFSKLVDKLLTNPKGEKKCP